MARVRRPPALSTARGRGREQLRTMGRGMRERAPRRSHAAWTPAPDRDPLAVLRAQDADRVPELVPVRYGRMLASPFAYHRGAAAVMAADLAATPVSGITVQACGDAHLLNFGVFASPERRLVFDVNDFDETQPGPWEWDVKRLAASFVVASREVGLREDQAAEAAAAVVAQYQQTMVRASELGPLQLLYSRLEVDDVLEAATALGPRARRRVLTLDHAARRHTSLEALAKLATVGPDGDTRIREDPPLIVRERDGVSAQLSSFMERYARSLPPHLAHVLRQYEVVDVARKVVGVGSVGLRAYVVLLISRAEGRPLFLQIKEAVPSVLAAYAGALAGAHGRRVVHGQRMMQAVGDPFLGWVAEPQGDFYVRQFRDMKASAVPERSASWFEGYAQLCGSTLAHAHARSAHPALIAGYIGTGRRLADAVARFARAYADRAEADWEALGAAVRQGQVAALEGR